MKSKFYKWQCGLAAALVACGYVLGAQAAPGTNGGYTEMDIISDGITNGVQSDPNVVNAWGIVAGTKSIWINDNETGLQSDIEKWLEKLAPEKPHSQYEHNGAEDNADAHLKRSVMGREVVVAITNGKLDFGPWEEIFYGEFDGNRRKRVLVKIIGE